MLAAEALSYTNEIWAHAAARIAAELGQGALPGYAEGEVLPYARG